LRWHHSVPLLSIHSLFQFIHFITTVAMPFCANCCWKVLTLAHNHGTNSNSHLSLPYSDWEIQMKSTNEM
jgi:hypothetical protein